jgi:DNA-directed RNA polymerase subunit H (RpoH/RPB5)
MSQVIEFKIYNNILTYLNIIKYDPVPDQISGSPTDEKDSKGYVIKTKDEIVKTLQFYSYVRIKSKHRDTGKLMYVYIVRDNSIVSKSTEFKSHILNTISEKDVGITVVSKNGIKTQVLKFISNYQNKTVYIRNFKYTLFKDDLRNNVMVPRHDLCTDAEKKKIMSDNFIFSETNFPTISKNDAQVLWLGGEVGQLVKIVRSDVTGTVCYYRMIINK